MLPKLLTENLCSLRGNVDRLAFSVIWEVNPNNFEIVNSRYGKSVIHSKSAMTYQMAQDRIDNPADNSQITQSLRRLLKFSQFLKAKRQAMGALTLASTQLKFKLDRKKPKPNPQQAEQLTRPSDVSLYTLLPTNSMIEEFMLLANISVGRKIVEHFPAHAILRKHSSPKPDMMKQFSLLLKDLGFALDYSSNKSLATSLDKIQRKGDVFFNKMVRIKTTRCMNEAVYFCSADFDRSEFRHYGLAADIYTHFTSPIRRYADVRFFFEIFRLYF